MKKAQEKNNESKPDVDKAKRVYRAAVDAIKRLDDVVKQRKAYREVFLQDAVGLRNKLKEYCERLMFYNPLEYGRKAEEVLWRKVFYQIIQLVKQNRKHLRAGSSLEAAFRTHLAAATGYYNHLLFRLQYEFSLNHHGLLDFHLVPEQKTGHRKASSHNSRKRDINPVVQDWATKACHRCLICLGDIARYQQDFDKGFSKAASERFYHQAVVLSPDNGMPHNQLGTLSGSRYLHCEAAYYYLRCLVCEKPFEGADGNLQRLFEKNRKRYQELKQNCNHSLPSEPQSFHDLKVFLIQFLHLLDIFFDASESTDPADLQENCQATLHSFNLCMFHEPDVYAQEDPRLESYQYLDDDMVFKLVVICMATIHLLQLRGSRQVTAATAFLLALSSHILNHVVMRLQTALDEKENPNKLLHTQFDVEADEEGDDLSDRDSDHPQRNLYSTEQIPPTLSNHHALAPPTLPNHHHQKDKEELPKKDNKSKQTRLKNLKRRRRRRPGDSSDSSDLSDVSDLSEGGDNLSDNLLSEESEEEEFIGFFTNDSDSDLSDNLMESQELEPGFSSISTYNSDKNKNAFDSRTLFSASVNNDNNSTIWTNTADNENLAHLSSELISSSMSFLRQNLKLSPQNSRVYENDVAEFEECKDVIQGKKEVPVPPGFASSREAQHVAELSNKLANFVIETDTEASIIPTDSEYSGADAECDTDDRSSTSGSADKLEMDHHQLQCTLEVAYNEGLLSVVKVMCDWMRCNTSIIMTCAQSSASLWHRLSVLGNLLPSETSLAEHDQCWMDEVRNILKTASESDWHQVFPLREDVSLWQFVPLADVHSSLKLNMRRRGHISEMQEMDSHTFVYCQLPGVNSNVRWPVQVPVGKDGAMVGSLGYCRSDDAWFPLKDPHSLSETDKWKAVGMRLLKKRPGTLNAFLDDIQWAIQETRKPNKRSNTTQCTDPEPKRKCSRSQKYEVKNNQEAIHQESVEAKIGQNTEESIPRCTSSISTLPVLNYTEERSEKSDIEVRTRESDIEGRTGENLTKRKSVSTTAVSDDTEERSEKSDIEGRTRESDIEGRTGENLTNCESVSTTAVSDDTEERSEKSDIEGRTRESDIEGRTRENLTNRESVITTAVSDGTEERTEEIVPRPKSRSTTAVCINTKRDTGESAQRHEARTVESVSRHEEGTGERGPRHEKTTGEYAQRHDERTGESVPRHKERTGESVLRHREGTGECGPRHEERTGESGPRHERTWESGPRHKDRIGESVQRHKEKIGESVPRHEEKSEESVSRREGGTGECGTRHEERTWESVQRHKDRIGESVQRHEEKTGESVLRHEGRTGESVLRHEGRTGESVSRLEERTGSVLTHGESVLRHEERTGESVPRNERIRESIPRHQHFSTDHIYTDTDISSDDDDDDFLGQRKKKAKVLCSSSEEIVSGSSSYDSTDSEIYPSLNLQVQKKVFSKSSEINLSDSGEEETAVARDVKNNDIYIRLVKKSQMTVTGKMKKNRRVYNSKHPCPFCSKAVANFSHHIVTSQHKHEPSVKEILETADPKTKQMKIMILRLKGAHLQNIKTLEGKKGEIFLRRRTNVEDSEESEDEANRVLDIEKYGPCPKCLGWITLQSIKRHIKTCIASDDSYLATASKGALKVQSHVLCGRLPAEATPSLIKEVFPIMVEDEVCRVAKEDSLIVSLGNQWMLRNKGNVVMRKYYTSSVMRLAAKLKLAVQHLDNSKKDLDEYFQPSKFDAVIKGALRCCFPADADEDELKSPSNAIKLGHDVKRMLSAKLAKSLVTGDACKQKEAEDFLKLMQIEWGLRVTKLARIILNERAFNQDKQLPLPEDIKKLSEYMQHEISQLDLTNHSLENYKKVAVLSLSRVTLFNRRRCHEVQALKISSYQKRKTGQDELALELRGELTPFERNLLHRQDVVVIRGKTGKGVPVILPGDTKRALQFLTDQDNRMKAGVPAGNPYVFGSTGAGVFRAYDAIRTVASRAELQYPNLIRSSNMRKYMATMLQCFLRIGCIRQFCHYLSRLESLSFSYNEEQKVFIGPSQPSDMMENEKEAMKRVADEESRRYQLMRDMAQLRLQAEVRQLEGSLETSDQGSFPPYLIPDTSSLCDNLPMVKQLTQTGKGIVIIPLSVIDTLDFLKKESGRAREAIRWLETEFRKGNRYIRAQKSHEKLEDSMPKNLKKRNRQMWCLHEILDCAMYLAQQGGDLNGGNIVAVLTSKDIGRADLPPSANKVLIEKEGVSLEKISSFTNKWKDLPKNKG